MIEEKKRNYRRLRKKARKRLSELLIDHEHQCYWCGMSLVRLKDIPKDKIISVSHGIVVYKTEKGLVKKDLIASVDHYLPLSAGGNNHKNNLVPSCLYCNEERGRLCDRGALHLPWDRI